MKKTTLLLISIILTTILAAVVSAEGPTTYYVDATDGNNTYKGNETHPFKTIQYAINNATDGDTIIVSAGEYVEEGQIVIDKNLTIIGENKETTIIKPANNTGSTDDARGWFLVSDYDVEFNLYNVTLDGEGKNIHQAIRSYGTGTIENNIIRNMEYATSQGWGIVVFGNMNIKNNTISDFGRIGVQAFDMSLFLGDDPKADDVVITENTIIGKGSGDFLQYGIEVGGGAKVTIRNNIIQGTGVSETDWSNAAIMVTDAYTAHGGISKATIIGNTLIGNEYGLTVGYDDECKNIVTAEDNIFEDNKYQIRSRGDNISVNLESILANNTFDKAVVVRGSSIKVPTIFSNIQDAIVATDENDTIEVSPGTYVENLTILTNNITLISLEGAENTIIKKSLNIENANSVTIDGFKFINEVINTDSIKILNSLDSIIKNSIFEDNSDEGWTRAINAGSSNVRNLLIENIHVKGGFFVGFQQMGTAIIKDSIIEDVIEGGINAGLAGHSTDTLKIINTNISVDGSKTDGHSYAVRFGQHVDSDKEINEGLIIQESILKVTMNTPTEIYDFSAIIIRGSAYGDIIINNSKILTYNAEGIISRTDTEINATKNYWGHSTGPYNAHYNPSGEGNAVSNNVSFSPFYIDEDMTELKYVIPSYTKIVTRLPYNYSETNNYWFNITLSDPNADNASLYLRNSTESFTKHYMTKSNGVWSYNVTNLTPGNYFYRFWANDSLGNSGNVTDVSTFRVATLKEGESVLDSDEYIVPENKTTLLVDNIDNVKNISVLETNEDSISLNLNNSRTDNKVVFTNNVTLKRQTSDKNLIVDISSNTIMSSSNEWDGTFRLPEIEVISEDDKDIGLAIKVGSNVELNFDKAVRIFLPGQANKEKVAFKRDGVYTDITNECKAHDDPGDNITPDGDSRSCYFKYGNDIIIWTYHFTTFLAYDDVPPPSGPSGGSTTIITRTGAPPPADDVDEEVVDEVDDVEEEPVDDVDDEVDDEPVDDVDDEVDDVDDEVEDDVSPGFMTGLVTGFRPGEPLNIVGLVVLLGLLGVYVFYRSFTVAGLSKRSARLHKKADNLGKSGKYRASIETRRKARRLQRRADEKGYRK